MDFVNKEIWLNGEVPYERKEAETILIPKPGKTKKSKKPYTHISDIVYG